MNIPFVDITAELAAVRAEVDAAIARVLDSGRFILGPEVDAFERELAEHAGCAEAVGVSSGTDALLASLMALEVGPGDPVVTTPFSFFATAGVISRLGARPVFADIDPETFNLDPAAAAEACTGKTRALIVVHLYGRPAEIPDVRVPVVEDAAQSLGAAPVRGRMAATSFFPTKNLGAIGDAGAILTEDPELAGKLRILRTHGAKPKYHHPYIGGNFRLDALQAAILRAKLPHLPAWTAARRANADRYRQLFADAPGIPDELQLPTDVPEHLYNQFVLRVPHRDELKNHLATAGIATEVYYPVPFHLQKCYRDLDIPEGTFPHAERAAKEVLALPIYPSIKEDAQAYIVDQIASFYRGR